MPTDDERCEVARKLRSIDAERIDREYGIDGEGGECFDPDMAKAGRVLMLGAIAEAVGLHYAPYFFDAASLRDRLADLIWTGIPVDPGEAGLASVDGFIRERTGKPVDRDVLPVDRDALLALADELDESLAWMDGDELVAVLESSLRDVSRRIREACGEG